MRLKNKKTGEVYELNEFCLYDDKGIAIRPFLNSLAELNEEWEDCEDPKKHYWVIDEDGVLVCRTVGDFANEGMCKQIGNYFETEEEAEKAVEKLKAWKRLKDKGFGFTDWYQPDGDFAIVAKTNINLHDVDSRVSNKDLDLLFGGEE